VRPYRDDNPRLNEFTVFVLFFFTAYFTLFELMEMISMPTVYFSEKARNKIDILPLLNISVMGIISLSSRRTTSEQIETEPNFNAYVHNASVWFEIAAIIMIWMKLLSYLKIWNSTNYLARMIE
jgi:hypothetical protein